MIYPLDQIPNHMSKPEHSLQWHILQAQLRTNELLEQMINGKQQETVTINWDEMKRPELMKAMSLKEDAPQGWNKWGNSEMIKYLKGES